MWTRNGGRGICVKVNVRINVRRNEWSNNPLPSQHMVYRNNQTIFYTHTRIPDCVQTMQNVRIIKLMAINEGGGGWQGYKPPGSLVISQPGAWSHCMLNGHTDMTMFCPHLFSRGCDHLMLKHYPLFAGLSPGNPHQPQKEEQNSIHKRWPYLDAMLLASNNESLFNYTF